MAIIFRLLEHLSSGNMPSQVSTRFVFTNSSMIQNRIDSHDTYITSFQNLLLETTKFSTILLQITNVWLILYLLIGSSMAVQ